MVMNFWEAQRRARAKTVYYTLLFIVLTVFAAACAEWAMREFDPQDYHPPMPYIGIGFLGVTFFVAVFQYTMFRSQGGAYVAETLGAIRINPAYASGKERQLLNIVEETAIASALPVPPVYLLRAKEINAFAAGLSPDDAVIAVTQGSLNQLSRDELQAVIAHEFGHVQNGDMLISMRLAAMIMGFFFILYIAMRILQFSNIRTSRDEERRGGNPIAIAAIILLAAGAFTWLIGTILKCSISRQREYLADASSVQYTRNPDGLANALRKIADEPVHDMPKSGMAFSHMYFEDTSFFSKLFASHPPIEKRIEALEGKKHQ